MKNKIRKKIASIVSSISLLSTFFIPFIPVSAEEDEQIIGVGINEGLVMDPNGDLDKDGVPNKIENDQGTNVMDEDTDGDGFLDGTEKNEQGTDPTKIDTDADGLHDDLEIKVSKTNPLIADENGNKILDGEERRKYDIPENEVGITGIVIGPGNVTKQFFVTQNYNLLVNQMNSIRSFDINEFGTDLTFEITIPLPEQVLKQQPILLKYLDKEAQFIEVKKQKYDKETNSIQATTDGGVHVVLSKDEYKAVQKEGKDLKKVDKKLLKELKKQNKTIKFVNLPNFELKASQLGNVEVDDDGQKVILKDAFKIEGPEQKATTYQITSLYEDQQTSELYATAATTAAENGMPPVIFIHGLNSSPAGAFEINMIWSNGGSTADLNRPIGGFDETYTGKSYPDGDSEAYTNVDVHFIDSIQADGGSLELPERLVRYNGYTPNEDLFAFQYYANGHVGLAADGLEAFVDGLRTYVTSSTQDFNIVAHSKGGLVSRQYIESGSAENDDGDDKIDRLITFGTPHMGVNIWGPGGDLDRDSSELWRTDSDRYCEPLDGEDDYYGHYFAKYFAFAGVEDDLEDVPDSEENQYHEVSNWNDVAVTEANSYHNWYSSKYNITDSSDGFSGFGDGYVSLDSALGSDLDPQSEQVYSNVDMTKKWLWIGTSGGHSEFKRLYDSYVRVRDILLGNYDE